MTRRFLVTAVLLAAAAAVSLAAYTAAGFRPAPAQVRLAWFCRVWVSPAVPSGPACAQYPAAYKPPWPYLGHAGKVVYPSPAP